MIKSIIEQELMTIDESTFQQLIFSFLKFKGYNYCSAPGASVGANKTSIGTPDGYFMDGEKFIFCEVTTLKRENNAKMFLDKLENDIKHCFNEDKTKISPDQITEVILAFNSKIHPKESNKLNIILNKYNKKSKLTLFSIQNLAEELVNFPNIDDFLQNVPGMEDIYSLESFVDKSEKGIRTDLKNNFFKQINFYDYVFNVLCENEIISISGVQGVGKTRMAVEIARQISMDCNFNVIIIDKYNDDLLKNINQIVDKNENYLFIFDNYNNHFLNLQYLIDKIRQLNINSVKFIITLKKQFLNDLEEELVDFLFVPININGLSNEDMINFINSLANEHGCRFKQALVDKLVNISKGNIGLCLMAVMPIFENNNYDFVVNSELIYKNYFENYKIKIIFLKIKIY